MVSGIYVLQLVRKLWMKLLFTVSKKM